MADVLNSTTKQPPEQALNAALVMEFAARSQRPDVTTSDESPLALLKLGAKSALHAAVETPIDGAAQLIGHVVGVRTTPMDLISSPPGTQFGSAAWVAETIGSGIGTVVPFMLTEKLSSSLLSKAGAAEMLGLTVEESGLPRAILPGLAKGTIDGALFGLVCAPSGDQGSFWKERAINGISGAVAFGTQAAVARGLLKGSVKLGVPVSDQVFAVSDQGVAARLAASTLSGGLAGMATAESRSLLSGNGVADRRDLVESATAFMLTGLALDVMHTKMEFPDAKAKAHKFAGPWGELGPFSETIEFSKPKAIEVALNEGRFGQIRAEKDSGLLKIVMRSEVATADGAQVPVIIRPLDQSADATVLLRVRQAQILHAENKLEGWSNGAPAVAVRRLDPEIQYKIRDALAAIGEPTESVPEHIAVIQDAGESFGSVLRRAQKAAPPEAWPDDETGIANFFKNHPAQFRREGTAIAEHLLRGGTDPQPSNQADGMNVDAKGYHTMNPEPTWGLTSLYDYGPGLAKAFAGKRLFEISPDLQSQMDKVVELYSSPLGQRAARKLGLTQEAVEAQLSRAKYLAKNGFQPFTATQMLLPDGTKLPIYDNPKYGDESDQAGRLTSYRAKRITLNDILPK